MAESSTVLGFDDEEDGYLASYGLDTEDGINRMQQLLAHLTAAQIAAERLNVDFITFDQLFAPLEELIEEIHLLLQSAEWVG